MKNQKATTFFPGENQRYNIKIYNVENNGEIEFVISINSWIDHNGGSDGEEIQLTAEEFTEFIQECQKLYKHAVGV